MRYLHTLIEQLRDTQMLPKMAIVDPGAIVAPDICASDRSVFVGGFFYIFVRWLARSICMIVRIDRRSWCAVCFCVVLSALSAVWQVLAHRTPRARRALVPMATSRAGYRAADAGVTKTSAVRGRRRRRCTLPPSNAGCC